MSVTLEVNNSTCQVLGLNMEQHRSLRKLMSYESDPQAAYFSGSHRGRFISLLDKKGKFPSGLRHYFVEWALKSNIRYLVKDHRTRPEPCHGLFNLSLGVSPYDEQKDAINAALKYPRGTITMPTGSGKSITMAMLINALQLKTLVVVPNLSLKHQLTESFKAMFGNLNNLTIENIDSPNLAKATDYELLIIDEAHHVAASTYRKLNTTAWTKIYRRYFFTATAFRSRDEEQMLMESISGEVIYRLTYKQAVDAKMIVPLQAYYITTNRTSPIQGNPLSWPSMYNELVVNNAPRNDLIAMLLSKLEEENFNALCLVKEVAHGKTLAELTGFGFAHGEGVDNRILILEAALGIRKGLIGTNGIIGEGVDTKATEVVVIAGLGKAKASFMQQVGRCLRRFGDKQAGTVILIKDDSHKWTKAHFAAQIKHLRDEFDIKPEPLPLDFLGWLK